MYTPPNSARGVVDRSLEAPLHRDQPQTAGPLCTGLALDKLRKEMALTEGYAIDAGTRLIIAFTYFYTAISFNPVDVSDNIKKYGGFIPGIRPGKPTTDYLTRILERLTLVGAVFLGVIAVFPIFISRFTGQLTLYLTGTSLLIVVGVALETMKQIEAYVLMRHYEGFMK